MRYHLVDQRLKQARTLSGLSLREAADKMGLSHNSISKFERGELKIDSARLRQFATAYGVTMDYMIPKERTFELGPITWFKYDERCDILRHYY